MGKTYAGRQNDEQNEEDVLYSSGKKGKLAGHNAPCISESRTWNLAKGGKPRRTLILNLIQSEPCEKWFQELFLKRSHGPRIRIPKHLVSFDEKYLRRCMEAIQMNASKGAACGLSVNLSSSDREFMADYVTVTKRNSLDATKYAIDYPVDVGGSDFAISSIDESIVGSIMGSRSMISILRSPLFQRLGISDHDTSFGGTSLFESKRCFPSDYQSSPASLISSASQKTGKDTLKLRNQGFRFDSVQRSAMTLSSGQKVHTDQSSASSLTLSDSQGMLHCRWDGDTPHFSFSLDDQKELYVARAWKVEVKNVIPMDYVYSFHLKPSGASMFNIPDNESDLIGKMKVSTSFSLSSNNSRITETEFVMIDASDNHARDMRTMSRHSRRSRKLSKVMELFKASHSIKQRTLSFFDGTTAIPEDFSAEKGVAACGGLEQQSRDSRPEISECDFLPKFEMAAIVVKDHIHDEVQKKEQVGGWGLKFLKKKVGVKQKVASLDVSATPEYCLRNVGDCSTSMDIIVPAGPHGGPKTRNNGGPSGLIERWKLGGQCDCGGWDVGCPLKILKAKPRIEEGLPSSEATGDCKSFDLFTEGSKQETPTVKMVNIHDGLYFISFKSSALSALQCFSIAVAIIHSQSPTLRPKHVQD